MTEDAGYCAKSRDTTVWYLISSRAIAESKAILQVAYLFYALSQELRSVACRFSVLRFLADFWLHVSRGGVCGGSKSLSKFIYYPGWYDPAGVLVKEGHMKWMQWQLPLSCDVVCVGCGAFAGGGGVWGCMRMRYILIAEVYEEVDEVDKELSLWRWRACQGSNTSDSDEVLHEHLYLCRFDGSE